MWSETIGKSSRTPRGSRRAAACALRTAALAAAATKDRRSIDIFLYYNTVAPWQVRVGVKTSALTAPDGRGSIYPRLETSSRVSRARNASMRALASAAIEMGKKLNAWAPPG